MKIHLVTPAPASARNGNRMTALRWAKILKQQGHQVVISGRYTGRHCDLLIALHALRSHESIQRYRDLRPTAPLIVALTGTDLYRDMRTDPRARQSLELATRLVVLQRKAKDDLPRRFHQRTRIIYQSAPRLERTPPRMDRIFKVCVVGHLRTEKDPMRTAMAARLLRPDSRITVFHIGRALSEDLQDRAAMEAKRNPRYRWLGELPHWKTRRFLAGSHLLSLTSRIEGSSNVLSEAIASSVPVIASRIPGLVGTLGDRYAGYFPVGDTRALFRLLRKAEEDPAFYRELKKHTAGLFSLVDPRAEHKAWSKLLREIRAR